LRCGSDCVGQILQGGDGVIGVAREVVHAAAFRNQVARLAGIREERHRRLGVDEDEVFQALKLQRGELGEVGEPLDRYESGTALDAGRKRFAQQLRSGRCGDAACGGQAGSS
jgi:hypothetical protein